MPDNDESCAEGGGLMSEVFRPYEKLVEIVVLGKTFLVPERNSLLRAFQFISPETIPYGRFCWNQECQYCKVSCQLPDDDQPRPILSCKFLVSEGMAITSLAPELIGCLRSKLGATAPPSPESLAETHPAGALPLPPPPAPAADLSPDSDLKSVSDVTALPPSAS